MSIPSYRAPDGHPPTKAIQVRVPPHVGIIVRLWRFFFARGPSIGRCAVADKHQVKDRWGNYRDDWVLLKCPSKADPRCGGGNCTTHCNSLCGDRCK